MEKVCSNRDCESKGKPLGVSNFYRKGSGYDSRCKKCINKIRKSNRLKKKKQILKEFKIILPETCEKRFAEALAPLFE